MTIVFIVLTSYGNQNRLMNCKYLIPLFFADGQRYKKYMGGDLPEVSEEIFSHLTPGFGETLKKYYKKDYIFSFFNSLSLTSNQHVST